MRILFVTGSAPRYMAPPCLAAEQVVCGPDFADERDAQGRWRSLKTPVGEYDLGAVVARLPEDQQPDVIVCLVDAARRSLPRGLNRFRIPRVLLVADTHHLKSPLIGMLRYATSEPFTRTVLLYDRHHAGVFRSAGVRSLHWFPGLTFPHTDETVRSARAAKRASQVVFVGQSGNFHPRRARLLAALKDRGLPLELKAVPQRAALDVYGRALVGFNASLNGDLNLRVFEILATGAALLTDRLAPSAGLDRILTEGREFIGYDRLEELVDAVIDALAQPARTLEIGRAGAAWFDANFNETLRRERFRALALENTPPSGFEFSAEEKTRIHFPGDVGRLLRSLVAYEQVQELHRTKDEVCVALPEPRPEDVADLLTTLPRVRCGGELPDLAVVNRADPLPALPVPALWCWDARPGDAALDAGMAGAGFARAHPTAPVYRRRASARPPGDARRHIIVVTDDPESGGVAQYNHTLMLALVRAGHRVSCVQTPADNPLIQGQRDAGIVHHGFDFHTGREFGRTLVDAGPVQRVFTEDPPDLIVFSNCCPLSNLAAREVARRERLPYICVEGFVGAYLAGNFSAHLSTLARQYDAAAAIVAVSEENRHLLTTLFGAPAGRTSVIHYGRPDSFFLPRNDENRRRLRSQLGLSQDAVVCLTTARLTAIKGFQHQLKAILRLKQRGMPADLHFVWAGDGDQRAKLEAAVEKTGLQDRVHFLGHRWDVADWYDAADIFVLTSHLEGMPLSIMEAMAKGLPVVASAVSGIPEELGDTGDLLPDPSVSPEKTAEALARTLARWSADPSSRDRLGAAARMRAEQLFREDRMVARTLTLIESHLGVSATLANAR